MIDRPQLLADLQGLVRRLEDDLRERAQPGSDAPQIHRQLADEYQHAFDQNRTGDTIEVFLEQQITQTAVAWVLSAVFVRFLEDNGLIDPVLSGPTGQGEQGLNLSGQARDAYFQQHPTHSDLEYLQSVFAKLAAEPATAELFGEHNAAMTRPDWLSGFAAQDLVAFFRKVDADSGRIVHDFTDDTSGGGGWNTRFLGDLYQDLSEATRKRYALLQTPDFVEAFILDRTLEPALDLFGLEATPVPGVDRDVDKIPFRMIDPACGSGHFLLGAFDRILARWQKQAPGLEAVELVKRTLASIHGVDLNPYAVAIARFRLLLSAMKACGTKRLKRSHGFTLHIACGDSLLHGERPSTSGVQGSLDPEAEHEAFYFATEDREELVRLLRHGRYHAVVANPPYITPKDKQQNANIRARYPGSCHMKYALSVPFMERIFDLAVEGDRKAGVEAGFTGQITANSFMKREFGKKLIEQLIPRWDLTHVVDTSGAYIPGHGTPTVILFGRNRTPVAETIRTAMGIAGEPSTPDEPARGLVWSAIVEQLDQPGSESRFISVNDTERAGFHKHPWSIGGGGAAELKEALDEQADMKFVSAVAEIGIFGITAADDAMVADARSMNRRGCASEIHRPLIVGDEVRDWITAESEHVFFPYADEQLQPIEPGSGHYRWLWPIRAELWGRATFSKQTYRDEGRTWWEWHQTTLHRLRTPLSIVFGEVATHNHFVLDRGGKVFKQTAPVIKLPADATEDDHLALLGLLNSSTACFWMKQVCFPKGGDHVGQEGARVRRSLWDERYAFNASNMEDVPLPADRPLALARRIDDLARKYGQSLPEAVCQQGTVDADTLADARRDAENLRGQMIALQEELDWLCYRLYGLIDHDMEVPEPPAITFGQRAFEIVLARQIEAGEVETSWFSRHGSTPITEIASHWPKPYRELVQRRIDLIESDRNIGLIERPEYKRRWNDEPWDAMQERALRNWLLDRLEGYFDLDGRMNDDGEATAKPALREPTLTTAAHVAEMAAEDNAFTEVARLYTGQAAFDMARLVTELIEAQAVPAVAAARYKPAGMTKHQAWRRTWDLQRQEDAIDARTQLPENDPQHLTPEQATAEKKKRKLDRIPVPPKYKSSDFQKGTYWSLRGKLDVPKERWVSFPTAEGPDGSLVIAWAGYDHLQLAQAIAKRYQGQLEREGQAPVVLLVAISELLPWVKQWHPEVDPEFGQTWGEMLDDFLRQQAAAINQTPDDLQQWAPPARTRGRRSKRSKKK